MTSVWGPLGWMTLHSMASLYPDSPSEAERTLMTKWLTLFQETITCPSCRDHFANALTGYRVQFPGMMNSRQSFLIATFRLHNSVNRRLHKPVYMSVDSCFETLRNVVKTRSTQEYRGAYYVHIRKHWRLFQDSSGIAALRKINEMIKVEGEYATSRSNNFEVPIAEDVVVITDMEVTAATEVSLRPRQQQASGRKLRFVGGVLRLQ